MVPGYSTRDKGAEEERCGPWRDYRRGGDEGWALTRKEEEENDL